MDLGPSELLIILAVVLLLFGGAKLPGLARSLGEAKREFHKATNSDDDTKAASSKPPAPIEAATNSDHDAKPASSKPPAPIEATEQSPPDV
jgi:sec-independent protein translocase protein TatA